jgi:hypothetical protein
VVRPTILWTYKLAQRLVIAVIGATVVLVGIAMIFLPGPAFIVIPTGLAILGIEFAWARRWLHALKRKAQRAFNSLNRRDRSNSQPQANPDECGHERYQVPANISLFGPCAGSVGYGTTKAA